MSTIPRSPVTATTMVAALVEAGASPFTARRALAELELRQPGGRCRLGLPMALEVAPETFVALDHATRQDLIDAVEHVSQQYLEGDEPAHYLIGVLNAAVKFLPLLGGEMTVGEARLRGVAP